MFKKKQTIQSNATEKLKPFQPLNLGQLNSVNGGFFRGEPEPEEVIVINVYDC